MALYDPAALRRILDDVRNSFPVSSVASATVKLVRSGHEQKGCCPFHLDRSPSFTIYAGDRRWHCFGCGKSGDVIDFVRELYGLGMIEAVRRLDGGAMPIAERSAVTLVKDEAEYFEAARRIWQRSVPIERETAAYRYLAGRRLGGPVPPVLRFARLRCKLHDGDNGVRRPTMVALVVNAAGDPVGVQRTFLTDDGAKAFGKDSKLSLGRVKGGAIRMAPALGDVCLTEGAEDALALQRMSGIPTWAAAGSSLLPSIVLPTLLRTVTIGADADAAGIATATEAARVFAEQGRTVRIIYPAEPHKDFNAELEADELSKEAALSGAAV